MLRPTHKLVHPVYMAVFNTTVVLQCVGVSKALLLINVFVHVCTTAINVCLLIIHNCYIYMTSIITLSYDRLLYAHPIGGNLVARRYLHTKQSYMCTTRTWTVNLQESLSVSLYIIDVAQQRLRYDTIILC